jgi:hypoxanthine phosphoribosyltransferase
MLEIPSYFRLLYPAAQIQQRIDSLAAAISADYAGRGLHLVGVLRGAAVFLSDLSRALNIPVSYDFIAVSSYDGTASSGVVRLQKDLDESVESRNVLIVEDITDTGLTVNYIKGMLASRKPASLAVCALLDRPHQRKTELKLDYCGFTLDEDRFVVGYGLDFEQQWRQLPDIYAIN